MKEKFFQHRHNSQKSFPQPASERDTTRYLGALGLGVLLCLAFFLLVKVRVGSQLSDQNESRGQAFIYQPTADGGKPFLPVGVVPELQVSAEEVPPLDYYLASFGLFPEKRPLELYPAVVPDERDFSYPKPKLVLTLPQIESSLSRMGREGLPVQEAIRGWEVMVKNAAEEVTVYEWAGQVPTHRKLRWQMIFDPEGRLALAMPVTPIEKALEADLRALCTQWATEHFPVQTAASQELVMVFRPLKKEN